MEKRYETKVVTVRYFCRCGGEVVFDGHAIGQPLQMQHKCGKCEGSSLHAAQYPRQETIETEIL